MKKETAYQIMSKIDNICTKWANDNMDSILALRKVYDMLWSEEGSVFNGKVQTSKTH